MTHTSQLMNDEIQTALNEWISATQALQAAIAETTDGKHFRFQQFPLLLEKIDATRLRCETLMRLDS